MERRFLSLVSPQLEKAFKDAQEAVRCDYHYAYHGSYPYIALGHCQFTEIIRPHLHPNMSVVDIGCGAGDKLLAFRALEPTLRVTGIEMHPAMCAFARYVAPFATVIEGNAFEQDFKQYDLLYMYRPIPDPELQAALEHQVMRKMKPGAVLVVYGACLVNMRLDKGWVKGAK